MQTTTSVVKRQPYIQIHLDLLQNKDISPGAKLCYCVILDRARQSHGKVALSQKWLAERQGTDRRATVSSRVKELIDSKLIKVQSGWAKRARSIYTIVSDGTKSLKAAKALSEQHSKQESFEFCEEIDFEHEDPSYDDREVYDLRREEAEDNTDSDETFQDDFEVETIFHKSLVPNMAPVCDSFPGDLDDDMDNNDYKDLALRLAAGQGAIAASKNKTATQNALNAKKRNEQALKNLSGDGSKSIHAKFRPAVSRLHALWHFEFKTAFPDVPVPSKWLGKESGQAAHLLKKYDEPVIAEAIKYFVRYWVQLKPRFKTSGLYPTIGFMLVVSDTIIPEAPRMFKAFEAKRKYDQWVSANKYSAEPPPPEIQAEYSKASEDLKTIGL